ncbi:uncharacterized protein At4g18257 [Cryptomeria japonica]|uniref:uncharacterized protein At4g18257 n=1 Tax=Cryptomeria japonica TaxID=3369 RepID=UPI0027DA8978|nr:uncharacterized protein At4g18257 [Cryptomeria japonica]
MMGESNNNLTKRVQSLGWLTESAALPKKQKAIEGVGVSSIVELRAQLYNTQEEAKRAKEGAPDNADLHRARKKPVHNDVFSNKNSGVEVRSHRDKLQLKAVNDGSASYAALEKKAELYSKLVQGELPDEEDKEKYCVDFLSKGVSEDTERLEVENKNEATESGNRTDDAISFSFSDGQRAGIGWTGYSGVGEEHKRLVREVNEETTEAREKASILKQRRQIQAEKNREKLRQAFLRKQIEKLKAAKTEENTQLQDS